MKIYDLPTSVIVAGKSYDIRSDYRAVLDICIAFSDIELTDEEKAYVALNIFFVDFEDLPYEDYPEAMEQLSDFLNMGKTVDKNSKEPKLIDWEQDFKNMVAPINKVAGFEIRAVNYMHWWTFISLYNEIDGDSYFGQIVNIRNKLAKHKKLEKSEQEFYRKNRKDIDFKIKYTEAESSVMEAWINGGQ